MRISVIGRTWFDNHEAEDQTGKEWKAEGTTAADLAEFAGRACYESWHKPNPATATNLGYIGNILEMGHFSVLEHGSVSFYVTDVSRALSHELVRHRHVSPSQQSQRFVDVSVDTYVVPPLFRVLDGEEESDNETVRDGYNSKCQAAIVLDRVWNECTEAYLELVEIAKDMGASRKEAREAARAVMPNMTPTHFVITANHRTWREFITKRGAAGADAEIRELALEILTILKTMEPEIYQDMSAGMVDGKYVVIHGGTE